MSYAKQTTVLSLAGLRRLRFQTRVDGTRIADEERSKAELAARTALAALALAGVVYQRDNGYDLRSRSLFVAQGPLVLEILGRDGQAPRGLSLDRKGARELLSNAVREASKCGLGWPTEPVTLTPAPKLAGLIVRSRELAATGEVQDGD
jgi:CRISPR-associated protein Csb1